MEVVLAVPTGSLDFWERRLAENGVSVTAGERRGNNTLSFTDPHGLPLTLHETSDARDFTSWRAGPVAVDYQVRGLHSVRLWERDLAATASFLTDILGFTEAAADGEWRAFALGDLRSGTYLEIKEIPDAKRGAWGTGGIHHVAWRVPDEKTELEVRSRIAVARRRPTEVIDRFWFKSVYFLEPGGVLFELATDGPGFAVDEDAATLGEKLVLPPWLEPHRAEIESALPPLHAPEPSEQR
jgi:glyoxalase family protein